MSNEHFGQGKRSVQAIKSSCKKNAHARFIQRWYSRCSTFV